MNDRLNIILIVIDKTYQFFDHKFLPDKQSDLLWVMSVDDDKKLKLKCWEISKTQFYI